MLKRGDICTLNNNVMIMIVAFFFGITWRALALALFCAVGMIAYIPLLFIAAAKELEATNSHDLVLNDRNEIIEGSVQPNQHPLDTRRRPQPTWMN